MNAELLNAMKRLLADRLSPSWLGSASKLLLELCGDEEFCETIERPHCDASLLLELKTNAVEYHRAGVIVDVRGKTIDLTLPSKPLFS